MNGEKRGTPVQDYGACDVFLYEVYRKKDGAAERSGKLGRRAARSLIKNGRHNINIDFKPHV